MADLRSSRYDVLNAVDRKAARKMAETKGQRRGLRQVFPNDDIFMVTDDEELAAFAQDFGLTPVLLDSVGILPEGANVALFLRHSLVSREIRKMFRKMRVLVVPIASFDPSLEVAKYTLELTVETDYEKACQWNRYWVRNIAEQSGQLIFEGDGTQLECSFADKLRADAWTTPEIDAGKWISVASFCEFSITAPSSSNWRGAFDINGTVVASGVLVARDPRVTQTGDVRIKKARRMREEMASLGPIKLQLSEGVLTSVEAGGKDFTKVLSDVTNPDYELHTLELGIGTNMSLLPQVDWTVNSQLNEGAGPVHLGFGEGMTGAHMDFVVARCEHRFAEDHARQPQ